MARRAKRSTKSAKRRAPARKAAKKAAVRKAPARKAAKRSAAPASHNLTPYLVVRGAADAIEFYKRALGAVESYRMPLPDGSRLLHAELRIGGSPVFIA